MNDKLFLFEEILLLGLKDEKGTLDWKAGFIKYGLSGAIIAELLLLKKIVINDNEKNRVELIDNNLIGNEILDESITLIQNSKIKKDLKHWVNKFSTIKKLENKIANNLIQKGILKEEGRKILFLFNSTVFPEVNPIPEKEIISRLEKSIFNDNETVDVRTCILIALTHKSDILSIVFNYKEIKKRKEHIEKIINGDLLSKEVGDIVNIMKTLFIVTGVMPAVFVATSS